MSVFIYKASWFHNPEYHILNTHHYGKLNLIIFSNFKIVRVTEFSTTMQQNLISTNAGLEMSHASMEHLADSNVVLVGLENRDYGHRGSVALTMQRPSIRTSWH
jgi:hypothetical protein